MLKLFPYRNIFRTGGVLRVELVSRVGTSFYTEDVSVRKITMYGGP
jgi:hypothetical protein